MYIHCGDSRYIRSVRMCARVFSRAFTRLCVCKACVCVRAQSVPASVCASARKSCQVQACVIRDGQSSARISSTVLDAERGTRSSILIHRLIIYSPSPYSPLSLRILPSPRACSPSPYSPLSCALSPHLALLSLTLLSPIPAYSPLTSRPLSLTLLSPQLRTLPCKCLFYPHLASLAGRRCRAQLLVAAVGCGGVGWAGCSGDAVVRERLGCRSAAQGLCEIYIHICI
jgi:hypothetical protein